MNTNFFSNNITIIDDDGPQDIFGSVSRIQHNRNNRGGGGAAAQDIGGAPPAGDPPQTGGGSGGGGDVGEQIGNNSNFRRPGGFFGDNFVNPQNAYDQTNNTYARQPSFALSASGFNAIGYSIPANNQIVGIEVRVETALDTSDSSTFSVRLMDGSTELGNTKTSPALSTTDTVITLGGPTDTWGRSWSVAEINNLALRFTASIGFGNNLNIDEIQVRAYFQAAGGGADI
jgi:hypothetical protein